MRAFPNRRVVPLPRRTGFRGACRCLTITTTPRLPYFKMGQPSSTLSRTLASTTGTADLTTAFAHKRARGSESQDLRIGRPMKIKGLAVNLGTNFGHRIGRG
jgi:hypothetical protein